jgi:DNA (cytosine-5)-methyltransferase 1
VISVGSLFSGIGGLDLAAKRAGMRTQWFCEIDTDCQDVLAKRFPKKPIYEDIEELSTGALKKVDLLCGGFPCQDLSVAGQRQGLAGNRSGLFYEFTRITERLGPKWLVIENVPGLLSSNGGRDMGTVLKTLGELGYGWAYRVLDAQNFGVPQQRRRVVIVGCLGSSTAAGKVLFESESGLGYFTPSRKKGQQVAALTANGVGTCGADDNQAQAGHNVPCVSPVRTLQGGGKPALMAKAQRNQPKEEAFIPIGFHLTQDPISSIKRFPCLSTGASRGSPMLGLLDVLQCQGSNVGPMGTLRAGNGALTGGVPFTNDGLLVRRLMPLECERLQGFPDGWTDVINRRSKPMPDSARYRMLGNAIAVPVFTWVLSRLAMVDSAKSTVQVRRRKTHKI